MTSLARDLEMIQGRGYELVKCRAVDQFCQTVHTECVCLLEKFHDSTIARIGKIML